MHLERRIRLACAALLMLLAIAGFGCDDSDKSTDPDVVGEAAPDFTLADRNPNSATFEQPISPRNYNGEISCWYFAAAT
jgi:hypothetical protein